MSNIRKAAVGNLDTEQCAKMFKALSHPVRLEIFLRFLRYLPPGGKCCEMPIDEPSDCQKRLAEDFGLAPSTISHHMKELTNAGLLRTRREGQRVTIWIDDETKANFAPLLQSLGK